MTGWNGFRLQLPTEIASLVQPVTSALDALRTGVEAVRAQLAIVQAANAAAPSVDQTLALLASTIESTLTTLSQDSGFYVLVVPLPKKGILEFIARQPASDEGTTEVRFPAGQLPSDARATDVFDQVFNPSRIYLGGNAHFVRTVSEAFYDPDDPNRPRVLDGAGWVYAALLVGAEDLSTALTLATSVEHVFGQHAALPATRGATNVVPTGVRGQLSPRGLFPVLRWDPPPAARVVQSIGNAVVTASRYAVIRATDWRIRSVTRISEIFATNNLTTGLQGRYGARVVFEGPYTGLDNLWTDSDGLDEGASRFYTVAFRTGYEPPVGSAEQAADFGYTTVATPIEIRRPRASQNRTSAQGRPPDWIRTPSVIGVFPAIDRLVDRLFVEVRGLVATSQTLTARGQAVLDTLAQAITRYTTQVEELTAAATQIANLVTASQALGGAFVRVASGSGPVGALLGDLVRSMDPGSDAAPAAGETPQYPPFTLGTEYVCGVVMVATGPDVSGAAALLQALFGQTPPSTEQQLRTGIDSIPQDPATVDPVALSGGGADTSDAPQGLGADGQPTTDGHDATCDPTTAATPDFDGTFHPR